MLLPSLNNPRDLQCHNHDHDLSSTKTFSAYGKKNYQSAGSLDGSAHLEVSNLDKSGSHATLVLDTSRGSSTCPDRHFPDSSHDNFPLKKDTATTCTTIPFLSFYDRHVPLRETVLTWRCYALMSVFMCVAGAGILVINNVQAIAQAVQEEPSAFFVTALSVSNAGGRVLVGVVADRYMHSVSRLQVVSVICVLMASVQFVLSLGHPLALYPCLLVVGVMFGAIFSSMAAVVSDIFGSHYVGSNYGFIDLAPAVGSYVFSVGMVALFYPSHNNETDTSTSPLGANAECVGAHCFRYAFWVTCVCCLGSAFLSYYIHVVTPINRDHFRL